MFITVTAAASAPADNHARRESPRSRGRTATHRITPATRNLMKTAPTAPSEVNRPTANAAPTSWLIAAITINSTGPIGERRCTEPRLISIHGGGGGRLLRAAVAGGAQHLRHP